MNILKKIVSALASQIQKNSVTIPLTDSPEKILDVDLSKAGGYIDENIDADLRSTDKPKRKRRKISTRTD